MENIYKHRVVCKEVIDVQQGTTQDRTLIYYSTSNKTCENKEPLDWVTTIYQDGIVTICKSTDSVELLNGIVATMIAFVHYTNDQSHQDEVDILWPDFSADYSFFWRQITSITSDELVE